METIALIPETTPYRYLSGLAALNLPSGRGTGDWHLVETFFSPKKRRSRSFIAGVGCETDTTPQLGALGIFECSALLDDLKIPRPAGEAYAANHARAIADLVLAAVTKGGSPDYVCLDDWMPGEKDKREVFDLLDISLSHLSGKERNQVLTWMNANFL